MKFQPDALRPSGRAFSCAGEHVEAAADAQAKGDAGFGAVAVQPQLLLRRSHRRQQRVGARQPNGFGDGVGTVAIKIAVVAADDAKSGKIPPQAVSGALGDARLRTEQIEPPAEPRGARGQRRHRVRTRDALNQSPSEARRQPRRPNDRHAVGRHEIRFLQNGAKVGVFFRVQ